MIWNTDTIQRLLDLYLEKQVLWDTKHLHYNDITARNQALQYIVDNLGVPNITIEDIIRKYKTMRAAYRVELRNIHAAKLRGFFYKPSLHWFPIYKQFMKDIESITMKAVPVNLIRQCGYNVNDRGDLVAPLSINNEESDLNLELSGEEYSSEDSNDEFDDEFQSFADHIAEQLRSMSVHRAVMIQNQIQRIFANDREIHDGYIEEENEEMII